MNRVSKSLASLPAYIAVILAGGAARRMEGDAQEGLKIHLQLAGKTLLQHICSRLENATHAPEQIVLNIAAAQVELVGQQFPLAIDHANTREGPLAGIIAALDWCHRQTPSIEWVLIASGDTPFLPTDLSEKLLRKLLPTKESPLGKVAYARSAGRQHPTISVWHQSLLYDLQKVLREGVRKVDHASAPFSPRYVDWATSQMHDPFFNINTPEDWQQAAQILQNLAKE